MSVKPLGLLPPGARDARSKAKLRAVLRWLRDETWSTPEILGKVMGLNARQGAYQSLAKMERDGYLASADVPIFKRSKQRIFGITSHGLAYAFDLDEPISQRPTFEPSKVRLSTLQHEIDIQLLRIQAELAGWTHWIPGSRLGASHVGEKRPDAVAMDTLQRTIAIEIERHVKSRARYEVLLSQYLQAVAKGRYAQIVWLCPSSDLTARLQRIIQSITSVTVGGKRVQLEERHYRLLSFMDYSQWPVSVASRMIA